jgi:hypothetical protein
VPIIGVELVDLAAGKGDLPGMVVQMRRAPGQDHMQPGRALDQPAQYGGRALTHTGYPRRLDVRVQVEVRAFAQGRHGQRGLDMGQRQGHGG